MKNTTFQTSDLGNINRAILLNLIKHHGQISRVDLTKKTNLAGPSVSRIVQNLLSEGLISEVGVGQSIGGRKPVLLTLRSDSRLAVGLNIRASKIKGIICNLNGEILYEHETIIGARISPEELIVLVIENVECLLNNCKKSKSDLAGIGLTIPGLVDQNTRIVRFSPPTGWRNISLKEPLSQHFKVPVIIENTIEVMTMAEKVSGEIRLTNLDNFVFLFVGYGIGAGIINKGSFFRGSRYSSIELGHTTIDLHGPQCVCGNYGCLEAFASQYALMNKLNIRLKEKGKAPIDSEKNMFELIQENKTIVEPVFKEMALYLGAGIANIINLFNPDIIVLGGWPSIYRDLVLEEAKRVAFKRSLEGMSEGVSIIPSTLGDNAIEYGAASLIIQTFFQTELESKERKRM